MDVLQFNECNAIQLMHSIVINAMQCNEYNTMQCNEYNAMYKCNEYTAVLWMLCNKSDVLNVMK